MFLQRAVFWTIFCCLCLGFVEPAFAASPQPAEAARVIAVAPGAFVQRGNERTPLRLKDPLYKEDKVSTNATGKLQLLFADDTTVAVAPDSLINIADFSFGGPAKASFALGVGRGLARVVTGKVVQRNREGFKVTTPHATVGIRGTILTADVRNPSQSKFILSQLGAGHVVSVVNASTGQHTEMPKAGLTTEAGAAGNVLRPATPAEMSVVQTVTRQTRQAPHPPATGNAAARGTATAARAQAQSSTAAKNPATMSTPAPMAAAGVEDPSGGHSVAGKGNTTVSQVAATAPKRNEDILHVVTGNLADSSAPGAATPDSRPGGGSTSGGSTPAPTSGGDSTPGGDLTPDPTPGGSTPGGSSPGGSTPDPMPGGSSTPGGDLAPDSTPGGDSSPGGDLTPGPAPGDDSTTGGDLTPDPMPGGDLTPGAGDNPSGITASYQGTLMGTESSIGIGGTFGFDVNLGSGGIDNGVMVVGPGTSTPDSAVANSFTNGTGQMDRDNGNFNVGDFTPDSLHPDASASMNGNISGNDTVTVEHWEVQRPGNPGGDLSGTGSGSKVSP
ncbi:FecR domain-containing protein [Desulfovibrio porci]|uniref:FecR family protein n=1 Tax=Desulfovibrio porci TaxID=2605782 RepID=UPI002A837628|nr:FecR domain-containing protein [Desulfovibrio porci]MDY3810745.1 FecR domain-containing protein [Desulfovibrio porci]